MNRGVLYYVWGDQCRDELACSRRTVERAGYDVHVVEGSKELGLAQKSRMYEMSPFDQTLFLDSDTLVVGDLDFGFEMVERHGLAICINEACDVSVHFPEENLRADLVEYNTGVMFFSRTDAVGRVFERWCEISQSQPRNDQPGFAQAVYELGFNPYVLPMTWNYRAEFAQGPIHGPVHVWHSRVPAPMNIDTFKADGFVEVKANALTRRTKLVRRARRMIRFQENRKPPTE